MLCVQVSLSPAALVTRKMRRMCATGGTLLLHWVTSLASVTCGLGSDMSMTVPVKAGAGTSLKQVTVKSDGQTITGPFRFSSMEQAYRPAGP